MDNPELAHQLSQAQEKSKDNLLLSFQPYDKQKEFLNAGSTLRIRGFMAGNRCGKTFTGSMEGAMHLTGIYPRWWKGKRFDKPIKAWAGSDTGESTRDILQEAYLGGKNEEDFGTGSIPKENIIRFTRRQGVADAIDTLWVKHKSGGLSEITFKSYDQGRKKWQGTSRDFIQLDEEPPVDIWAEAFTRTMTTKGHIIITFTPLNGLTEVCEQIMEGGRTVKLPSGTVKHIKLGFFQAGWADCPYLTEDDMAELMAGIPSYEIEARMKGIPSVGRGRIFAFNEDHITVEPFAMPKEWKYCYGLDFGWRATAASFAAFDPNTDTIYIYDEYKAGEMTPEEHTPILALKGADWQNGVVDPAGQQRNQKDGTTMMDQYSSRPNNLRITVADNSVEAGLALCNSGLRTGKIKIFSSCTETLRELSKYSRDDKGKVIKKDDHIMDSFRYVVMSGYKKARMKTQKRRFVETVKDNLSWLTV